MAPPLDMAAVEIAAPGGPEVLRLTRRPVPKPEAGEVLIEVAAAGVNRPDVLQRQGHYSPPPGVSDIPGLEVAGRIVAKGEGVMEWHAGDAVCALVAGGGYAEYCAAPAPQCLPVKGRTARALLEKVWPLLESGEVRPILDRTFPLAEAADAHRLMESSQHIGKIVLAVQR